MMRRLGSVLLTVLVLVVCLCSCELSMQAPKQGKVHILVYGNDYHFQEYSSLNATVNDAVQVGLALSRLCEKQGDVEYQAKFIYGAMAYPFYDDLIDQLPFAERSHDLSWTYLESEIERIADESKDGDLTFFFFSGHGDSEYKSKVEYGTDTASKAVFATRKTKDSTANYLVSISTLTDKIVAIKGTKVVFSDFCYSGSFVQAGYVSVTGSDYKEMTALDLFSLKSEIRESSSTFFLSASRYYEQSYEEPSKTYNRYLHGYFSKSLLNALGWDDKTESLTTGLAFNNGCLTFFNVSNYVMNNDDESRQTPMYNGGSNDIILFSF